MNNKFVESILNCLCLIFQSLLEANNKQQLLTQQQLLEKDTKLTEYQSTLERLQSETPNATNLLASIESDKIAASRAMAQNQELKIQLDEIQKAYVQLVSGLIYLVFGKKVQSQNSFTIFLSFPNRAMIS